MGLKNSALSSSLVTARCITQVACTQRGRRKRRQRAAVHETGSVAILYTRKASSNEPPRTLANRRRELSDAATTLSGQYLFMLSRLISPE
ncbi:hypothetical protein CY35_13G098200 [Sphagnum magellanicum]|nr:hypothetical protein CY35_13G098200 [Sphagnum magellanicum]